MNPSTFTQALADEICERRAKGEPLAVICRDPHMPAARTERDWRKAHPEYKAALDAASDDGHDLIAHRARQTARGKGSDAGGDSTGDVQRDKLIIDTDLKLLAKWDPRRYGERVTHVGDAEAPVQVAHSGTVTLDPSEAYLRLLNGEAK